MAKVAEGIRYAERVVAREIVACEYVRLACQRFLDDLAHGEERGIFFSEARAQHILNFYKFVPHVKGALAGQPIELMDWHVFILINIFGFVIPLVNEATGEVVLRNDGSGRPVMVRRFRTAYNEVARKNAKSTLSSGVGLYMTGADGEGGAEVYSAATTRDQARIVFEDAKNMVKKAKATLGRLFEFNKLAIYQEQSSSKFEPLSSDANNLDGLNIHCGIVDELHAHKTRDVWDVLETATGARLQSLLFGITTAGFNKEGICYELRDYAIKVLQGYNSKVETIDAIMAHAAAEYPRECCGVVAQKSRVERYFPCRNQANEPTEHFVLSPEDYAAAEDWGTVIAIVHSHPDATTQPSELDKAQCDAMLLPWHIVSWPEGDLRTIQPRGELPLLERPFVLGIYDCWGLVMSYYRQTYDIELPDYRVDYPWWEDQYPDNLYQDNWHECGFREVTDSPQPGDVVIMQVQANKWNHAAILLEGNMILHHMYGMLSNRVPYGGYWQERTMKVLRYNGMC